MGQPDVFSVRRRKHGDRVVGTIPTVLSHAYRKAAAPGLGSSAGAVTPLWTKW